MKVVFAILISCCLLVAACSVKKDEALKAEPAAITYQNQIKALVQANCTQCHFKGVSYMNGGDLSSYDSLMYKVNKGVLSERVLVKKDMPPGNPLDSSSRALLQGWLDNNCPL